MTQEKMFERGDELLEAVLAGHDADGEAAYGLLKELFKGYPKERLRRLLTSEEAAAVKAGAWLVSELGRDARPLLQDVVGLLGHPLREARFWALDAIQSSSTAEDGPILSRAIALIDDPDAAVRWEACQLLAHASAEWLAAAMPHLEPELRDRMMSLAVTDPDDAALEAALASDDRVSRLLGAVAAARRARTGDVRFLEQAKESDDDDVSSFALDFELRRE